jgi:hypothetical protein
MRIASLSLLGATLLLGTPAVQALEPLTLPAGATIPVTLDKRLDARKNKVGDEIVAWTTDPMKSDRTVVMPKGSKIVGHVTEVKAWTKEERRSMVGVIFERAVSKDGREALLALEVQAVGPAESPSAPLMAMTPATAGGSSGGVAPSPAGGATYDPNAGTPGRIASPVGAEENSLSESGRLTPKCRGVLGIDGLALVPAESPHEALIVSQSRNVHLDSGTQMMLRVVGP